MLYYFDESGDQGFVDKASSMSEYGILAGISISECAQEFLERMIGEALAQNNIGVSYKKLHCSEIFKNGKNSNLREALYSVLSEFHEYQIIYEGQYSVGVKNFEESKSKIEDQYKENVPDNIKIHVFKERIRLYISLLTGIIFKLEEFAILKGEKNVCMISDRMDQGIEKEAHNLLKELRSEIQEVTANSFDIQTGRSAKRSFNIISNGDLTIVRKVADIIYLTDVTLLSFVADFICFELLRHFRKKMKIQQPIKFHTLESLEGFQLKDKVAFLGDNYFSDMVFDPIIGG